VVPALFDQALKVALGLAHLFYNFIQRVLRN
jgi:hypothetical protein